VIARRERGGRPRLGSRMVPAAPSRRRRCSRSPSWHGNLVQIHVDRRAVSCTAGGLGVHSRSSHSIGQPRPCLGARIPDLNSVWVDVGWARERLRASKGRLTAVPSYVSAARPGPSGAKLGVLANRVVSGDLPGPPSRPDHAHRTRQQLLPSPDADILHETLLRASWSGST
jgi:hypothetical protein